MEVSAIGGLEVGGLEVGGKRHRRALCWVRRDLRLRDHRALFEACEAADEVAVVFVFDSAILSELVDEGDTRVTFIHRSLVEMDSKLRAMGSRLVCVYGNPVELIPDVAKKLGATLVVASHDREPYAMERDDEVRARLAAVEVGGLDSGGTDPGGVGMVTFKDHVIFESGEVMNQAGLPFRVYTPYSKTWRANFVEEVHAAEYCPRYERLASVAVLDAAFGIAGEAGGGIPSLESMGFVEAEPWLAAGEDAAYERLEWFDGLMGAYKEQRDFPAIEGTSGMSAHLRFGTISVRELVRAALRKVQLGTMSATMSATGSGTGSGDEVSSREVAGADKWLAEVIWRDFYHDILGNFPRVVETTFSPLYEAMVWPGSEGDRAEEMYAAWEEGRTGYPIVDAAMRCLNQTGWMHNRLRMVVASFLTKHLLIDYRRGEAHFARKLLDFDLACNNGGWQWAASVGCDAQPYFRVFNPYLQSKKFDSDGTFIRQWVPEIASLSGELIHEPTLSDCRLLGYPSPIVDHSSARDEAIKLFKSYAPPETV